jgi:hypothetical protein
MIAYGNGPTAPLPPVDGRRAKLRVKILSEFRGAVYPVGTGVVLVESLGAHWLVEVRVPDESLVGGASYDTFEVAATDLEIEGGWDRAAEGER